uniref:Copper transport protein n=1 Tax=Kalanchoe fedtschenkoi TaxID=63787 RepID=A0A7N0TM00_KALFE
MMHMTFYWGKKVTILFDSWRTDSWTSYAISLAACLLVAAFYQYLEDRRIKLKLLASPARSDALTHPLLRKIQGGGARRAVRVAGSVMFGVNSAVGYMLMLAVMSFNWGVFLAIVAGLTVGYGVFRSGDEDEGVVVVDNPCACA